MKFEEIVSLCESCKKKKCMEELINSKTGLKKKVLTCTDYTRGKKNGKKDK